MSKVAGSALLKELTSARSAATVVAGGCHQLITPAPRFNRLLAPCPRRAQTAGDSRSIAGSGGCPRPAQSSGPPRWIARIKLVPKLTVRLQLPPPAPRAKSVTRMCGCSGEEFPYCVKAAGFASRRGGLRAGMRLRPVPPSATSTKRRDELDPDQNAERPQTMAWRLTPWQFRPYQRSSSTRAKYHNGPDSASCLPWVRILPPAMLLPSVSQWVTGRAVGLPK